MEIVATFFVESGSFFWRDNGAVVRPLATFSLLDKYASRGRGGKKKGRTEKKQLNCFNSCAGYE